MNIMSPRSQALFKKKYEHLEIKDQAAEIRIFGYLKKIYLNKIFLKL